MNRRMVYIRWLDHQENDESTNYEEEVGPAIYHSVGFVTGDTEDWLELARDLYMEDDEPIEKERPLCILKRCILTMKELS